MKCFFENISKIIRAKPKKWMKSTRESTYTPCASPFRAKNVIKGKIEKKIAKNGHLLEIVESFQFFEKKKFTTSLILAF